MSNRLEELMEKFNHLESELLTEIQKKEKEFSYEIRDKKVRFKKGVERQHKLLAKKLGRYLREAKLSSYLTTPVIISCIIPAALMDA